MLFSYLKHLNEKRTTNLIKSGILTEASYYGDKKRQTIPKLNTLEKILNVLK